MMTLAEAAKQWLAAKAAEKEAKRKVDEAAKVLKPHFRKTGKTSYAGVGYSKTDYWALDTDMVRELLGDQVSQAETLRSRETLTALK
jgi:hypothetical protein